MPWYKKDAVLAKAVDTARAALTDLTDPEHVGEPLSTTAEGDRLVTHRFTAHVPGYRGWQWFATLARAPRSKKVTVCELGLLPGEDALLAPEWVPWSQRVTSAETAEAESSTASS